MSNLERFIIKGLFNEYDVDLNLSNEVNVFVGENGMGKTTILNCLYNVLSGRIESLSNIVFEEITVFFEGKAEPVKLLKKDLVAYMEEQTNFGIRRRRINSERLKTLFSNQELMELRKLAETGSMMKSDLEPYVYRIVNAFRMSVRMAYDELRMFIESELYDIGTADQNSVITFIKGIKENVEEEILYFPTYRRIEEDMSKLGLDTDNERNRGFKKNLIQFGMSDVENAIESMLETIRGAAITGFNKMTGILLHQYVSNQELVSDYAKIDIERLNIALNRIGSQIEEVDKQRIRDLAETGELYQHSNAHLLNLVRNLIESYNKQSYYDERIKKFRDVCNGFLEGKQYLYDESELKLNIYKNNKCDPIQLKNLSSGEKQIISVFSKLYLEGSKEDVLRKYIILFDEPELSLSIKWQMHFLPDIMLSKKCSKLIAVTHSPFIFDNCYDEIATDMGICISEVHDSGC